MVNTLLTEFTFQLISRVLSSILKQSSLVEDP